MRLLIDIGNTSAKVAVCDGKKIIHFERREEGWTALFSRLTTMFGIDGCVISNVGGEDAELRKVTDACAFPVRWLTWSTPNPFTGKCGPQGYGADRWAADIGAMAIARNEGLGNVPLLVVDAGTCITYDMLDKDWNVTGGNISPGIGLRLKAMHEHTALLPVVDIDGDIPFMGYDTETAMRSGAVLGARMEIEGFVRKAHDVNPDIRVYVTGGNRFEFSEDVLGYVVCEPMLIFMGLTCIEM